MKILIISHYAGNKGDRAVLYYLLTTLHGMGFSDITVSTNNQKLYAKVNDSYKYPVRYIPWGRYEEDENGSSRLSYYWGRIKWRFYRKVAFPIVNWLCSKNINILPPFFCNPVFRKYLKDADLVISTGGHHLTTRFYQNGNCSMIYDLILTKLCRKKYVIWSQTLGPFHYTSKVYESAMKSLIRGASKVFVRDLYSKIELQKLGLDDVKYTDSYESVMGLSNVVPYILPSHREKIIGMTVYNAEYRSREEHEKYIREISSIADYCCGSGFHVRFFSHEMVGAVIDDRPIIREITCTMKSRNVSIEEDDYNTFNHLHEVAKCRMFIGHKTHSVVFGLVTGTPMLAISYHPKTVDFMKMYNLSENCISENELCKVPAVIKRMLDNLDAIGLKQHETSEAIRKKLRSDLASALQ